MHTYRHSDLDRHPHGSTRHDDDGAPLLTRADAASRHCRADSVPACSSVLRPIQKPKLPTHIQEQPHPTHCLALCLRSSDRPLDSHPWSFLPSPPARLTSFVSAACRGLSTVSSALQLPLQVQAYGSKASIYQVLFRSANHRAVPPRGSRAGHLLTSCSATSLRWPLACH